MRRVASLLVVFVAWNAFGAWIMCKQHPYLAQWKAAENMIYGTLVVLAAFGLGYLIAKLFRQEG